MSPEFELPWSDEIFMEYFDRWYSDRDRKRKGFRATRPDFERHSAANVPAAELTPLTNEGVERASHYVLKILEAARGDWPAYLNVSGPPTVAWIGAFDDYWDRWNISELLDTSEPADFSNELLVTCCEFGAVLGDVLMGTVPALEWCYGWPYWESALHHRPTGYRVNVFHWAIKRFSEYGVEDGYVAKLAACSEYLQLLRARSEGEP